MPRKNKTSVNYQILTPEQLIKIFHYFALEKKYAYYPPFLKFRTLMSYYLQLSMGLRPKECYNILLCNLDMENRTLFIPETDNKERFSDFVYIPDDTYEYLKSYLAMRKKYHPDNPYLFPTRHRKLVMDEKVYARMFSDATFKLGINKVKFVDTKGRKKSVYNGYTLRHTYLTNAWLKLRDIRKIKILARHRDYDMRCTSRYIHTSENLEREGIVKELQATYIVALKGLNLNKKINLLS